MEVKTLFQLGPRTDIREAYQGEPRFEFLNRVSQPYWAQVRDVMEAWFARVPTAHREDLRKRFRSPDDRQHAAAFWELYLHENLSCLGYALEIHPTAPGEPTHPDFLVRADAGDFYLEAVAGTDSDAEVATQRRLRDLYRTINQRLATPNFMLWVNEYAIGSEPAPGREVAGWLERWLQGLDPDEVAARLEKEQSGGLPADRLPTERWIRDGWDLRFRAVPLKPEARDASKHWALGAFGPGQASAIDTVTPLRSRLERKATRYGDLSAPYVVAVLRNDSFASDEFSVTSALYGSEAVQFDVSTGEATSIRNPDGFWTHPPAPRFTNVSAVVTALNLSPWTVATVEPHLWLNPWATRPLQVDLPWKRTVGNLTTGLLESLEARQLPHEVLEIPEVWPVGEPFVDID